MSKLYLRKVDKNSYLPKRSKLTLTHSQKQHVKNIDIMSIYPYELNQLPKINYNINQLLKLRKTLQQAQKQEKLLELYKELTTVKNNILSQCYITDTDTKYFNNIEREMHLEDQIKELENEKE